MTLSLTADGGLTGVTLNADGTLSVYEGRPGTGFDIRSLEGTFPVGMEGEDVTVWRVQRTTGEGLEEVFRGSMPAPE